MPFNWRPRFSLSLLLYFLSLFSISLALYLSRTELLAKRTEVESLRATCGYLTINDPAQPQVIRVPSREDTTFIWRLYLPADTKWELALATDGIPSTGEPTSNITRQILASKSSEFILQLRFERDTNGQFVLMTTYDDKQTSQPVSEGMAAWLNPKTNFRSSTGGSMGVNGPGKLLTSAPNDLLRLRVNTTGKTPLPHTTAAGLLVQLRKIEEPAAKP